MVIVKGKYIFQTIILGIHVSFPAVAGFAMIHGNLVYLEDRPS